MRIASRMMRVAAKAGVDIQMYPCRNNTVIISAPAPRVGHYLFLMERLSHWGIDIHHGVITALLDVKSEVSAGDDVDDLLDADISHAV